MPDDGPTSKLSHGQQRGRPQTELIGGLKAFAIRRSIDALGRVGPLVVQVGPHHHALTVAHRRRRRAGYSDLGRLVEHCRPAVP